MDNLAILQHQPQGKNTMSNTYTDKRYLVTRPNREGVSVWYDPAKGMYYIGKFWPTGGGLVRHYSKSHSYIMKRWERSYAWIK